MFSFVVVVLFNMSPFDVVSAVVGDIVVVAVVALAYCCCGCCSRLLLLLWLVLYL